MPLWGNFFILAMGYIQSWSCDVRHGRVDTDDINVTTIGFGIYGCSRSPIKGLSIRVIFHGTMTKWKNSVTDSNGAIRVNAFDHIWTLCPWL
jgi:hypothetical protein